MAVASSVRETAIASTVGSVAWFAGLNGSPEGMGVTALGAEANIESRGSLTFCGGSHVTVG